MANTTVLPIYNANLKVGTKGLDSKTGEMVIVAGLESLNCSIEGNMVSWTEILAADAGWEHNAMTGKAFSVEFSGKRKIGDAGNDYMAGIAFKDGLDCSTKIEIEFSDGSVLSFDAVVDITGINGGDAKDLAPLEGTLKGDGRPQYVEAA